MSMIKRLFKKTCARNARPILRLEPLEDRQLLSTCHVTRLTDQGVGKGFRGDLRYCINKVNAEPGSDVIDFTVTGTISLTGMLPNISDDLVIDGPGADNLTVRRGTGGNYRVFRIEVGVQAEINHVTITNGLAKGLAKEGWGGGIYNSGSLSLTGVKVWKNRAEEGTTITARGGGIFNEGVMVISNSTISANLAIETALGEAKAFGGGIANHDVGFMTILNSTINANEVRVPNSTTQNAYGGGISNQGHMVLLNTTVVRNKAMGVGSRGGGIRNEGIIYVTGSTISANVATRYGGLGSDANEFLRNTIVANNQASIAPDIGDFESFGHNLFGNSSGGSGFHPSDLLDVNPLLGALADNGGPTLTMALLPGSPAIDAGDNTDAPEWDQRGPGFPRIVNGTIDIGAFEVQAAPLPDGGVGRPAPSAKSVEWAVLLTADLQDD